MSSIDSSTASNKHWRSLAELDNAPEFRAFLEAEFPETADPGGLNRRRWLQIMGASFALAGVAGCEARKQELLPFAHRPEGRVPGQPQRYATAMDLSGHAIGLLVTCVDGRPIKIEGNPLHPQSLGATHALAQASLLSLYDPDRSQNPVERVGEGSIIHTGDTQRAKWAKFDDVLLGKHFARVQQRRGASFYVLSEATSSPTLARLRRQLLEQMPDAQWLEYEPLTDDQVLAGARAAFGKPVRTQLVIEKAQVIVCLDADLLASHPASLSYTRAFAKGREVVDGTMNRLYVVESAYSVTGAAADHRLPLRPSQLPAFVGQLHQAVERLAAAEPGTDGAASESYWDQFVSVVARDLHAHRGTSVVAVGPQQPPEVHAAVHRLNALLGNVGQTIRYTAVSEPDRRPHVEAIVALAAAMHAGSVDTLLILGGNPVYDAPADVDFAGGLAKVPTSIHVGLYRDETALQCLWHVPQSHFLENWGDARSFDGTYSVVQPTIAPLHGGRSFAEILARVMGQTLPKPEELVKATFQDLAGGSFDEKLWRRTVHDGLLANSAWPDEAVPDEAALDTTGGALSTEVSFGMPPNGQFELVFLRDASVYDGRFANNSWLQECPDPLTKLTWDNAAVMSPATANALHVSDESLVTLQVGDMSLEVAVYRMPGWADGVVGLALGYGRTAAGSVGGWVEQAIAPVGVNAYRLRTSQTMFVAAGLNVADGAGRFPLSVTQDHHAIDAVGLKERARRVPVLLREGSLAQYVAEPDFAQHMGHPPESLESLWTEFSYEGQHRWGMSIDLSKCTGCNACVVACQAENNVPVVGKAQVKRGREMHWIRVDRYFQGDAERPEAVAAAMQPVTCHHCELAPCEQVCPVAATVHSSEGLNDMVYNRCIGTRYCGNNCPYKVRRFNYFNYHKDLEDPSREITKMVYNPDVTVRSRGVMEKCTYCVQRIQAAKIQTRIAGEPIPDGTLQTACQQVCPAQAIVFGDLADPTSRVRQWQQDARAYGMLAELNTKPRTMYLAKIRNPHPDLAPSAPGPESGHA
ncbi:MAG: TAT-variant-translocated molybdopterin oxidoreductase [Pirellulaceae bacterium]